MNNRPDKKDLVFIIVLVAVHAVFFLLTLHYKRLYTGDSFEYVYEAINIREHGLFYAWNPALPLQPEYLTFRTPLYPLFLLLVYACGGSNWTVLLLQALVSVGSMLLLRHTLLQLGFRKKYDWLLLLLLVSYPAQFIHANQVEPELLLQLFSLLYCRSWLLLFLKKDNRHAWWSCLWMVIGILLKPVWYPFVPVHAVLLLLFAWRHPANRKAALLTAVLPLLCVLLYQGWNKQRTGVFHMTSNQSFNAIFYYNYYFGQKYGVDSARSFLRQERAHMATLPTFAERYAYANGRGAQLFRDNFTSYMPFHLKHSARLLVDPGKGDLDLFTGKLTYGGLYRHTGSGLRDQMRRQGWMRGWMDYMKENPSLLLIVGVFLFNLLRLLGFALFFTDRRPIWPLRWWCLLVIGYIAFITGPVAAPRYLLPVSLLLAGTATLGFQRILSRKPVMPDQA